MDLFGIGPLELLLVLLLALLLFGPRDLEKAGRSLGRGLNKLIQSETWRTVTHASRKLKDLPRELMRQANIEEMGAEIRAGRLPASSESRLPAKGPSSAAPTPAADGEPRGVAGRGAPGPRGGRPGRDGKQAKPKTPGGNDHA